MTASVPRPDYPRPQFVRPDWINLNGAWEFCFDDADGGLREGWSDGRPLPERIVVPFPYQSPLSGIGDTGIHEVVWYARSFEVPARWLERDLLLHFGAVDYETTVWVNGHEVGHNRGGHVPFWFDVAPYVREGENRLTLRVEDRQDPRQPRGKQASSGRAHEIDYFCSTGIWQTVWLEPAPPVRIDSLRITPDAAGAADVTVFLHAPASAWRIHAELCDDGVLVARAQVRTGGAVASVRLELDAVDVRVWSPEDPHLYDLVVRLLDDDGVLDEVRSYVGLRTIDLKDGWLRLNGQPLYLKMVLDQGYWPDGLLAAPSDEALREDVEWAKRFGFNGARKHQKIEDPRWLYWCDRLGLLVWEEMPNARAWSSHAEELLLAEWERAVERDHNHPCVVALVPVNETMGFPGSDTPHPGRHAFLERVVTRTRLVDATRPVIDNGGWEHTDVTDICAIHDYTPTAAGLLRRYAETLRGGPLPEMAWLAEKPLFVKGSRHRGQPVMLTEVGGFLEIPPGVPPERLDRLYGAYGSFHEPAELLERYRDLMRGIGALTFVTGFCYTQLTDIEQERNGLLTYDRRPKVDPERIARIHDELSRQVHARGGRRARHGGQTNGDVAGGTSVPGGTYASRA